MITAIKVAGDQKNSPTVIDLGEHCPTCKDVQESFAKLKKLCLCSKSTHSSLSGCLLGDSLERFFLQWLPFFFFFFFFATVFIQQQHSH